MTEQHHQRWKGEALYFFHYAAAVFVTPYLPLLLRRHVAGLLRLGIFLGTCRVLQVVASPILTYAGDGKPKWVVFLLSWALWQLTSVGLILAAQNDASYGALFLIALIRAGAEAPVVPCVDSVVAKASPEVSTARRWGTIAWGGLAPSAGIVFEYFGFSANVGVFAALNCAVLGFYLDLDSSLKTNQETPFIETTTTTPPPPTSVEMIEPTAASKLVKQKKKRRRDLFPNPFKRAQRIRAQKYQSVPDFDDDDDDDNDEEDEVESPDAGPFARFENPFRRNHRRDDDYDEVDDEDDEDDLDEEDEDEEHDEEVPPRNVSTATMASSHHEDDQPSSSREDCDAALALERLSFLIRAGFLGAGSGYVMAYLMIFIRDLGGTAFVGGAALLVESVVEAPIITRASAILRKYGSRRVLDAVHFFTVLRFLGYVLLRRFHVTPLVILAVEPLHGLTVPLYSTAAITRAKALYAGDFGQGLFAATYTVGNGLGAALGGALVQVFGFEQAFLVFAVVFAVALPVLSLLQGGLRLYCPSCFEAYDDEPSAVDLEDQQLPVVSPVVDDFRSFRNDDD